jgi:hypothetical protein
MTFVFGYKRSKWMRPLRNPGLPESSAWSEEVERDDVEDV